MPFPRRMHGVWVFPGLSAMKLEPWPGKGMNRDAIRNEEAERYFFHFPDGNASIARLIVRQLVPDAIAGNSAADVVTAKANYAKLDSAGSRRAHSPEQYCGESET